MNDGARGIQCGDLVTIRLLELSGYVTAICTRHGGNVSYEVSYFSNGEYNQKWFDIFEIKQSEIDA